MSVVGGPTRLIFCEGEYDPTKPASLDVRLLNRLLHDKPPTTLLQPAGGKQQLRAFIRGRLAAVGSGTDYVAFRDRDFDAEPPSTVSLIQYRDGAPVFMSHRAAIENYLIDGALIDRYWSEHFAVAGQSWKHGQSPGINEIRTWMDDAARQLLAYQSARWALARLKPTDADRWPEIRDTWTEGSGHLPSSLDEHSCLERASTLVREFTDATALVSEAKLMENYKRFFDRFSAVTFFAQGEYSIWFHGKDLQKAMQRLRRNSISLKHFFAWAVDNLDWTHHADIQELAGKF